MIPTSDPKIVCFIAKDQRKGTIQSSSGSKPRACFFIKLSQNDTKDKFLADFRAIVNAPSRKELVECDLTTTAGS